MDHSINGGNRLAHLQIVVVGLFCATLILAVSAVAQVADLSLVF